MARGRPHKCPYCEATTSVAKGFRYNKGGKVKLRRCKVCGRRWTVGLASQGQALAIPAVEKGAPAPDSPVVELSDDTPDLMEQREEPAINEGQTVHETELPLGGEGSPSQNDSGEEESEEIFFAQ